MHFKLTSTRKQKPKSKELSKRQQRLLFLYVLPYSFLIVGGLVAFWGIRNLVRARDSVNWPCAEGRIVSSSVRQERDKDSTTYHANVLYEYSVSGIVYDGSRVAYGDYGSSDSSHARGIVERYPEGDVVAVYFKPDQPQQCVLEPGLRGQAWVVPIFGSLFFFIGCAMAIGLPIAIKKPAARHYWYDDAPPMPDNDTHPPNVILDAPRIDHPPPGIRMEHALDGSTILRVRLSDATAYHMPLFALAWNGFLAFFIIFTRDLKWDIPGISFIAFLFGKDTSAGMQLPVWLLLLPLIAVGLYLFSSAFRGLFGRCVIRLGMGEGSVFTGIGSFGKTKRFSLHSVTSVEVRKATRGITEINGQPVCHLTLGMNDGSAITLPRLSKTRETWLAFALNKLLGCAKD